jgi:hypothetical protein
VVILSPAQFLSRYAFFTDPTYSTTNVVLTRVRGESDFSDVDIACLGTVTGWPPAGSTGEYEVAHVDLFRGGVATPPTCATSSHEATSAGAFGITVWGTDSYELRLSAGGNLGVITTWASSPSRPTELQRGLRKTPSPNAARGAPAPACLLSTT